MRHISTTPFGRRPVTAGLIANQIAAQQAPALPRQNKWTLFDDLCTARTRFGLSDRDMTVLNALLSFLPGAELVDEADMIVFPSNKALCARAHGMAESTVRRHLAALVGSGLLLRHDSPNGKRFASRDRSGTVLRAFGFDLRPLLVQADKIAEIAAQILAETESLRRAREEVVLNLRDAAKLGAYGRDSGAAGNWDALEDTTRLLQRQMRRKLDLESIKALSVQALRVLQSVSDALGACVETKSVNMSGNDVKNERHHQNSKPDSIDLEPCLEKGRGAGVEQNAPIPPKIPLQLVLKACPEIILYAGDGIRHWHELIGTATYIRGMMGISPDAWQQAQEEMGAATAAIVLACMLERVSDIHSPGGYLRSLSRKAAAGAFSPGPMVMALLGNADKSVA